MIRNPLSALALLGLALVGCGSPPPELVLISLDTVRADHLPFYGYDRATAPRLTALAEGALLFRRAYSQDTNTNPSHATIFTGLYPHQHGARFNGQALPPGPMTLAEALSEAGFATGAFVSGWPLTRAASGMERGFEVYDDEIEGPRRPGIETLARALDWWRAEADRPRFLFLHLYDAHGPYLPPTSYAERFRSTEPGPPVERIPGYQRVKDRSGRERRGAREFVDAYDAQIRLLDDLVNALLAEIDLERTVVVVLSDHGETLLERFHALDHGGQAFEEQLRIPLLIHAPGIEPAADDRLVEAVDLAPTLLHLLGIEGPEGPLARERSLLAPGVRPRSFAFGSARAESSRHADREYALDRDRRIHAVRSERYKLISYPGLDGDHLELYDLLEDPGETRILPLPEAGESGRKLERALARWRSTATAPERPPELDPEAAEQLRALGYLE